MLSGTSIGLDTFPLLNGCLFFTFCESLSSRDLFILIASSNPEILLDTMKLHPLFISLPVPNQTKKLKY